MIPSNFPFYYLDALTGKWCCANSRKATTDGVFVVSFKSRGRRVVVHTNLRCGLHTWHDSSATATPTCARASCPCRPARCDHTTPHHTPPHHATPHHTTPHHTTDRLQLRNRRPLERIAGHATYAQYRKPELEEVGVGLGVGLGAGRASSAAVDIDGVVFLQSDRPFAPQPRRTSKACMHRA